MTPRPLGVSVGDPAGVGPGVSLAAVAQLATRDAVVLYGDATRLREGAIAVGIAADRICVIDPDQSFSTEPGAVSLVDAGSVSDSTIRAYAPSAEGGRAQMRALSLAADAALSGKIRGLVTGPVSKEAIVASGTPFVGHTEYLAQRAGLADDDVTMLFLGPRLSVALVTTHLSVRAAADAISEARVSRSVRHLYAALSLTKPAIATRITVTGLNPHAGEGGLFGDEELRVIAPALQRLRASEPFASGTVSVVGPRPAEAAFREAASGAWDGVVAMVHDQATIASKLLDWGNAVNVTWGLPFVRTSVDHGVAYDAAASGRAESEGMLSAFALAQRLTG